MFALPTWPAWVDVAVQCTGAITVWSLSLYVVSRGGWQRVPVLATLAMWSLVLYELDAMGTLSPDLATSGRWFRVTWPGPALLPALWFALTAALALDESPEQDGRLRRRLLPGAAVVAVLLGIAFAAGAFNDLVRTWHDTPAAARGATNPSTPGPLYPAYVVYVLACLAWGATNLVVLWRSSAPGTPLRARFRWLLVAAGLFLLGALYLTYAAGGAGLSGLPGHVVVLAGMAITGWSIARYGALLAGEVVADDFVAYGISVLTVVLLYGALLFALGPLEYEWIARVVPLLLLVVATHVFTERRAALVERLLYGPVAGVLRADLRALANQVVRQPDPLTALAYVGESLAALVRRQDTVVLVQRERPAALAGRRPGKNGPALPAPPDSRATPLPAAEPPAAGTPDAEPPDAAPTGFRVLVEGSLRHLNNLPSLGQHPLLAQLPGVCDTAGPLLDRARALRQELHDAIGRLRPETPRPSPGHSAGPGGWLHYLVLHEAYVEDRPNKQIMQRYHLSEGTFHRARRRAIDAVALDLYQRAAGAGGPGGTAGALDVSPVAGTGTSAPAPA